MLRLLPNVVVLGLLAASATAADPGLRLCYRQPARHWTEALLIASSQPGDQPANLQGIWLAPLFPVTAPP